MIRIGASSAASCCGYGFDSRSKLWRINTGREERTVSPAMQHGTDNEGRAVSAVECLTGLIFDNTGSIDDQAHLERSFNDYLLVAHPDGTLGKESLEVKCPMNLKDEVPQKYQIQMAVQQELGGFDRTLYAEWTPAETRMWWCYQNPALSTIVISWVEKFVGYVIADQEPPSFRGKGKPKLPEMKCERVL